MHDNIPAAQCLGTRQNRNKPKLKTKIGSHSKTVRPASRGNQNFEAARCYKSRKIKAVRTSSRGNQNFKAAQCFRIRLNGSATAKRQPDLTAATQLLVAEHLEYASVFMKRLHCQDNAVRHSPRTHQNFEAATSYRTRKIKYAIKRPKHAPPSIASTRYKPWASNPDTKNLRTRHPLCLLYTSPSPRARQKSRMPSSA